ncbi:hypothetical protein GCM10025865_19610 [Paraoerskovia sediminicola]|uniref:Uncharacterized protein n=1 Tax=Paraoerskovia sediminicola TaxID=1138587 RepID=A0ABN6XG61_9CELL|nr:hypothetical protein GCM10025865_19610 [Paraoerskovia sediminicola]
MRVAVRPPVAQGQGDVPGEDDVASVGALQQALGQEPPGRLGARPGPRGDADRWAPGQGAEDLAGTGRCIGKRPGDEFCGVGRVGGVRRASGGTRGVGGVGRARAPRLCPCPCLRPCT